MNSVDRNEANNDNPDEESYDKLNVSDLLPNHF